MVNATATAELVSQAPGRIANSARSESFAAHDEVSIASTGKQYVETVAMPLRGTRSVLIRVVESDPPQRLVTDGDLPLLLPRMEIEFRNIDANSCEVAWRMLSRAENAVVRWTVLPFARLAMGRRARTGLGKLKERLEAGDATAPGPAMCASPPTSTRSSPSRRKNVSSSARCRCTGLA
ncbi:SRPBCC family protein [Mycobacterium hubeiense]|uniref:SRPBCC family protein n=1 Tax=Mycobacterium hubeiense TaxID=1867256 RepID=UPI001156F0DF|nr:SRPBCC family protein [Mycobacterium sp. QGD 101]